MKCPQCGQNEAGEGLCSENVDRSGDMCLDCRKYNIHKTSGIYQHKSDLRRYKQHRTELAECMAHRLDSCMCVRCLG